MNGRLVLDGGRARWTWWLAAGMLVLVVVYGIGILFDPFPAGVADILKNAATGTSFYGAAILCIDKGRVLRVQRFAWFSFALALVLWASADMYYSLVLSERDEIPYPSVADGLWLAFYLPAFAAIFSLLRQGAPHLRSGAWMDALIGGLGVGSAAAVTTFGVVLTGNAGTAAATATILAYPVGDLALLALVVVAISVTGWKAAGVWRWIAVAFAIFVVADSVYLVQVARGTYRLGGLVDLGWPLSAVLIGLAACRPHSPGSGRSRTGTSVVVPAVSGVIALGLLVVDHFVRTNPLALGLAAGSILLIVARQYFAVLENRRLLELSRKEATTDALTGLGNRRQLTADLAKHLEHLDPDEPLTLTLFDLDGFKQYNDTFGHPAGDQLLERLATRLRDVLSSRGTAYRMGGDEFCALWKVPSSQAESTTAAAVAALSEHGEAFSIGCSHGSVQLPTDTVDHADALRTADRNMYICKRSGRTSAGRQSVDVLHRALVVRHPELGDHIDEVADLATATAKRLRLSPEDVEVTTQTALLHTIGKFAMPDAVLNKAGPLDDAEWAFMREHPLVGERIITAAPALARIARLVRATHERHDGYGYPDGLRGAEIPVIACIVAACGAYHAMTSDRSYRARRDHAGAIRELRRGSGTQFDPEVVEALLAELDLRHTRVPVPAHSRF